MMDEVKQLKLRTTYYAKKARLTGRQEDIDRAATAAAQEAAFVVWEREYSSTMKPPFNILSMEWQEELAQY